METLLCFPCDATHGFGLPLMPGTKLMTDEGPMAIGEGGLDQDATQVRAAGLGNGAAERARGKDGSRLGLERPEHGEKQEGGPGPVRVPVGRDVMDWFQMEPRANDDEKTSILRTIRCPSAR